VESTYSNSFILKVLAVGCVLLAGAFASGADLSGTWKCDDSGTYQIREIQKGNVAELFWYGKGNGWQNVFHGTCNSTDTSSDFVGRWADVPPFGHHNEGTITVRAQGGDRLIMVGNPSNFLGRTWTLLGHSSNKPGNLQNDNVGKSGEP
jgi:hypothetical protein